MKVYDSDVKYWAMAARDVGAAERNLLPLINNQFGDMVTYFKQGISGGAQLRFKSPNGTKVIYVFGFEDASRWKVVLGGTLGGGFIDEANIASMDFIREYFGRLVTIDNPYTCMTLNPDDPEKEIYKEYINKCRPLENIEIPDTIAREQETCIANENWRYWHFTFKDNPLMTQDKIDRAMRTFVEGTIYYITKILGLRAKSIDLIFGQLSQDVIITKEQAKKYKYARFVSAIDTSYSNKTDDTIVWGFGGITTDGIYVRLNEMVANNRDKKTILIGKKAYSTPFAASDVCEIAHAFLEKNNKEWGFARDIIIDGPATVQEYDKMKRANGWLNHGVNANSIKSHVKVIDRCIFVNSWLAQGKYKIINTCKEHIHELENYSFVKGMPEDSNNHTIDEASYEWIPYRDKVGI